MPLDQLLGPDPPSRSLASTGDYARLRSAHRRTRQTFHHWYSRRAAVHPHRDSPSPGRRQASLRTSAFEHRHPLSRKEAEPRGGRSRRARPSEAPRRSPDTFHPDGDRNSKAGRSWYDWLPIFDLTEAQVFDVIRAAGQSPHPAYGMGMSRLSCVFCIMASRADLRTAARLQPALYRRYVRLEECIGHTLSPTGVPLPALTGVPVEPDPGARRYEPRPFPLA